MDSGELHDLFRSEMGDETEDYLWTDAEVYVYIDSAQRMFARLTEGIADATTTDVCEIEVAEGDTWIDLHEAILKIRMITRASDGREVEMINVEEMPSRGLVFLADRTGPLRRVVVGLEEHKLRAAEVVSEDETLNLAVFRLPLEAITTSGQELEIAEQHHYFLLDWAKSRAYLKQDAETFDRSKSAEFEARFRAYCNDVRLEQRNKRHKVRTVVYGGI